MYQGCVTWNGQEGNPVWFPAKVQEKNFWNWRRCRRKEKVFPRYREKAIFYGVSLEKGLEDIDYMPEIEKMRITEGGTENFPCMSSKMESFKGKESLCLWHLDLRADGYRKLLPWVREVELLF